MACRERDIAESLTEAINNGSYSRSVEAVRTWVPVWKVDDLVSLRVHVAPATHTGAPRTRAKYLWDYPIVVGFGQAVDPVNQRDEVDALADLVEEVVDEVKNDELTLADGSTKVSHSGVEYLRHADPEFLIEKGIFVSLVSFSYGIVA